MVPLFSQGPRARRAGVLEVARRRALRDRRPRLEMLETRQLLSAVTVADFPVTTPTSGPFGVATGPDGNLWFTESSVGKIGVINPTTHTVTEFTVPTAASAPMGIAAGPDGNLWFTEEAVGKIGTINPTSHTVTEFTVPSAASAPMGIAAGPDGNLWFTEFAGNKIGEINPTSHAITEFALPTAASGPFGIAAGPDGNLWFTEAAGDKIGVINPTSHAIADFTVPTAASQPFGITAGLDGNLWFTENAGNKIGVMNPTTHAVTEFAVPTAASQPYGITAGPDGNLWFTELGGNKIGAINPITHGIAEYAVPTAASQPRGITAGPDGNVWFTEYLGNKIGVAMPATHLAVTAQPATVVPNTPFSVSVALDYDTGMPDTSYNGPVTIALAYNPAGATLSGTLTATVQKGVATFNGLALNNEANGYRLMAYTDPLTTTLVGPINVATPATIIGEKVITTGKGRRRRVVGYELDFNEALDPATAQNVANYVLSQLSGPKRHRRAQHLGFTVKYDDANHSVTIMLNGRARFVQGGTLLVRAQSPGGVTSARGAPLVAASGQALYMGDLAFSIARKGNQISAYNGAAPPVS